MEALQKFPDVVISLLAVILTFVIFQSSPVTCSGTFSSKELTYIGGEPFGVGVGETRPVKSLHQISNSISRNDNTGNVIFNDNIAFGGTSSSSSSRRQERNYNSATGGERGQRQVSNSVAGGFLQNHRLEGPLSPEVASSSAVAAAAAATTTNAISPTSYSENDLKLAGSSDNRQQERSIPTIGIYGDGGVGGAGATFLGGGQERAYMANQYQNHGWASNSGSCLFSCSAGNNFGGATASCCQQNYVQCCPNPQHEQWNFKNLHHGRGYGYGSSGSIIPSHNFKGGNGWGSSLPYNPPPIVRPKVCQPHHHQHNILPVGSLHAGGNILHKGIATLKHGVQNIGQFFKGHVGSGWTAGGNGAAGYYFHRRSDDTTLTDERKHYGINSSKKRRHARSVNKGWGSGAGGGFDQVVVPCPVYSSPPNLGWPVVRPHSVGLGSLIGWTVPGYQIHGGIGYSGGLNQHGSIGYSSGGLYQHGSPGVGSGWGGSNFCRSDYECPGKNHQNLADGVGDPDGAPSGHVETDAPAK
ncbi:unnamed protein product [Orchesella dallaii]|uniref:Uncharacterized protein n=1 Tax=Orchesella dallaii TaxID=48710 RepID=A0ABP1PX23_9HEXA